MHGIVFYFFLVLLFFSREGDMFNEGLDELFCLISFRCMVNGVYEVGLVYLLLLYDTATTFSMDESATLGCGR